MVAGLDACEPLRRDHLLPTGDQGDHNPARESQVLHEAPGRARVRRDGVVEHVAVDMAQRADLEGHGRLGFSRAFEPQPTRHRSETGPLDHRRDDDDEEDHVEEHRSLQRNLLRRKHQRERCQGNRYGAFQADPRQESQLLPLQTKRQRRNHHGQWTGQEHEHEGDQDGLSRHVEKPAGETEQAEGHEHDDLRQPGDGVVESPHSLLEHELAVADDDAGQVDREEAAAGELHRDPVHQQPAGADQHRVQPRRSQLDAVDNPDRGEPARQADHGAGQHLRGEELEQPWTERNVAEQEFDAANGEEDRHRIIRRALDLQQGRDPLRQRHPSPPQDREHGRRVGRPHDAP